MSAGRDADKRITRPLDELPVLTDEVDARLASGLSPAQIDALIARIERLVLDELRPQLEDAVHQAVRAAVDEALAPPAKTTQKV